jgi:hypothetical protein
MRLSILCRGSVYDLGQNRAEEINGYFFASGSEKTEGHSRPVAVMKNFSKSGQQIQKPNSSR